MASGASDSFVITGSICYLSPNHSFQEMVCLGLPQYHLSTLLLDRAFVKIISVTFYLTLFSILFDLECLMKDQQINVRVIIDNY